MVLNRKIFLIILLVLLIDLAQSKLTEVPRESKRFPCFCHFLSFSRFQYEKHLQNVPNVSIHEKNLNVIYKK